MTTPGGPDQDQGADQRDGGPRVVPPPLKISFAFWLVAAVLTVIGPIRSFLRRDELIDEAIRDDTSGLTPSEIETGVTTLLAVGIVLGVVFAALYVGLALKMRTGQNWARIALTAAGIVGGMIMMVFSAAMGLLSAVTALAAIVLMYIGSARPHFRKPEPAA